MLAEIQTLEENEAQRKKNYDEESDNLSTGIEALDNALSSLKQGAGEAMLLVKGVSIRKVLAMGEEVLSKEDASALRRNLGIGDRILSHCIRIAKVSNVLYVVNRMI